MSSTSLTAAPSLPGVVGSVLDLIGETPIVRLRRLVPADGAQVVVKLEGRNPGGSAKDRAALALIRDAESTGALVPGAPIVESTSGNTGIGLALVGRVTGHPVVIVHGGTMSPEKLALLRLHGAELIEADWTAGPDDPGNPRAVADRIARDRRGWRSHQYDNPANPGAHYRSTGPEIWRQTGGAVTHLVASIGTGGTISGTGRFLREVSGDRVRVVGANPVGSTYGGGPVGTIRVEGVGTNWPSSHWPENFDRAVPHEIRTMSDEVAFRTVARLASEEALLVGPSSGLAVGVALELATELDRAHVIVVVAPDSATNYLGELAG
ncbi:MAG: PLP-dependent cysteine synthase family protein [Acidobacteria bacterium]|nr:PLP-dependent cysteine synthase family protein [Acidobacteriota bacterium]